MKLIVPAALMLLISDPGTVSAQEPRLRGVATAVFEEQVNKATAISSNPHGTSHSPDEDSSPDSNSPDEDYDDYDDYDDNYEEDEPEEAQSSFVEGLHKPLGKAHLGTSHRGISHTTGESRRGTSHRGTSHTGENPPGISHRGRNHHGISQAILKVMSLFRSHHLGMSNLHGESRHGKRKNLPGNSHLGKRPHGSRLLQPMYVADFK